MQTDIESNAIQNCMEISIAVLLQCRHKGAIEGAGFSFGKLVKCITTRYSADSDMYKLALDSVNTIFKGIAKTDTTRRGAGFSIMIHHLVKNDRNKDKVRF